MDEPTRPTFAGEIDLGEELNSPYLEDYQKQVHKLYLAVREELAVVAGSPSLPRVGYDVRLVTLLTETYFAFLNNSVQSTEFGPRIVAMLSLLEVAFRSHMSEMYTRGERELETLASLPPYKDPKEEELRLLQEKAIAGTLLFMETNRSLVDFLQEFRSLVQTFFSIDGSTSVVSEESDVESSS